MPQTADNRRPNTLLLPDSWLNALNSATTEKEIVAITKDFIASWSPLEFSRLPEACRPGRINHGDDIAESAMTLSREHLSFEGSLVDRLLIDKMATFFAHASARLSRILADRPNVSQPEHQ